MQILRLSNLPNFICVVRILLVVPIVQTLVGLDFDTALILILIAGFSDGLDGFLARRYGWTSRIGGLLDPLADKLLFMSVFGALTWVGLVPLWLLAVVVGRDIVIVSGAIAYEMLIGPVEPRPSVVGKLNTALALLYLFFVICFQIFSWPSEVTITLAGAGVFVISLISGLDYVLTWSRRAVSARGA